MNSLADAPLKHPATPSTFDRWAEVYDEQINPFLSLEERILTALLPDLRGLDVLDAGCGTGRTLGLLKSRDARRVVGVDSSRAMLERARQTHDVEVHHGSCTQLPIADAAIDCVISSFVLSYISNLAAFADELVRVTRPGATVFLSDVHPETSQARHWKRSFRQNGQEVEIAAESWKLEQIRAIFSVRGFRIQACIEPTFAAPEETLFANSGRADSFTAVCSAPAIYVLVFVRERLSLPPDLYIKGARCALTPTDAAPTTLTTRKGKVSHLATRFLIHHAAESQALDLTGYLILPGLINAHDHLEFGLFPRLGHGPYNNSAEWATDIHQRDADTIALHRSIPRDVRIWWGAIRNLLSGVTTVCHHNPLTPEMFDTDFPVAVLRDFQWAHSLSVNGDLTEKFAASPPDQPFIVHAAEGIDAGSAAELHQLYQQGVLSHNTVLVHGLALQEDAVAALNDCGAALITCPSSNAFLFNQLPAPETLAIKNIALGSDSPLTAVGDLLDELRFAHTHTGLDEDALYRMVAAAPAGILRLKQGEGRIAPGSTADFIATKDRNLSPAATLAQMSSQDVELVVRKGRVFLASDAIFQRLPREIRTELSTLIVDGERRWIRAPLTYLFHDAAAVMDGDSLSLAGKKVTHGDPA